ncbi:MAG TPA: glycosyltransferase family 4 protein [Candidatus Binataceae bacterium]|nr:glycosyltransferase family 4 protein [Candidatus Binataceae bacterium]
MARILIVAYTSYHRDSRVKRNAEALAERGDQVDVICLSAGPQGLSRGVNIIGLPMPRYRGNSRIAYLRSYLNFFIKASRHATRLSRYKRYDVVIICTMPDAAVLCALGPKFYGAKVILDVHDTMPELYQDKFSGFLGRLGSRMLTVEERASAWFADRVLAVHEPHRQRLASSGIPAGKLNVVMNLPDQRLFRRSLIPENTVHSDATLNRKSTLESAGITGSTEVQLADREGAFKLVCHGTITFRLGIDVAIQALALLHPRIPGIHLDIIGEGDFLASAKELAGRLGLQQHVTFTPSMAVEQLPSVLTRALVGIVPNRASRATHLMLPAKLLEYATLGMPVIAARLRTMEYYFPATTVQYFEPGDVQGLVRAINDLYRFPEKRRLLGRRAAEVASRLSWEQQRAQLFDSVDSLLVPQHKPAGRCREFQPLTEIR